MNSVNGQTRLNSVKLRETLGKPNEIQRTPNSMKTLAKFSVDAKFGDRCKRDLGKKLRSGRVCGHGCGTDRVGSFSKPRCPNHDWNDNAWVNYHFKLTWLVLGGDPAARSHRVEQFTAL